MGNVVICVVKPHSFVLMMVRMCIVSLQSRVSFVNKGDIPWLEIVAVR